MATFHMCTNGGGSIFFNSLIEMMSSVADIICIAQIIFKLIYNALPAINGWFPLPNLKLLANFWTHKYCLYWIVDVVAKIFELFSCHIAHFCNQMYLKMFSSANLISQGNCYVLKINNKSFIIQEHINLHFSVISQLPHSLICCE